MAWYDSFLNFGSTLTENVKAGYNAVGSALSGNKTQGTASVLDSFAPKSVEPNMSSNYGPARGTPTGQVLVNTPQGAQNVAGLQAPNMSTNTGIAAGSGSSVNNILGNPGVVRPISTAVSSGQQIPAAVTQPTAPRDIYTNNPTNTPTVGQSGLAGATSTSSLNNQPSRATTGMGSFSGGSTNGTSGATGDSGRTVTGFASSGTTSTNVPNSSPYVDPNEEQKKKLAQASQNPQNPPQTQQVLSELLANLQGQARDQLAINPEKFFASATPNVNQESAATDSVSKLVASLSNPAVKMTADEANSQFQQIYQDSYQKISAANPLPAQPVISTPEQQRAEQANPSLQQSMDQARVSLGLPDLEKQRIDLMNKLNAQNETYNTIVRSIKDNPEIPLSLQQRRLEEWSKSNDIAIKSFTGQLDVLNQQIDDGNSSLNRQFQIEQANRSAEERKLDNNRALLGTLISTGTIANFSDAQISQWAKLSGLDVTALKQLSGAVRDKAEAVAAKDERAAITADARLQQIIASTGRSNISIQVTQAGLDEKTQSAPGQLISSATGNPVKTTEESIQFVNNGQQLKSLSTEVQGLISRVPTGAISGWTLENGRFVPIIQSAFKNDPASNELLTKLSAMNNLFVYFSSGKAIAVSEFERLQKQLPNTKGTTAYNTAAINGFNKLISDKVDGYLNLKGWKIKEGVAPNGGATVGGSNEGSGGSAAPADNNNPLGI